MIPASRNRNLIIIILALLLTNIGLLVYFLGYKQPNPRHRYERQGMTRILEEEVGFNESQITEYKQLKDRQKETVRPLFDDMRKAKHELFKLIADPNANDSMIQASAAIIAEKQKALDLQTFGHFKRVRSLCSSPQQQTRYDSAMLRMLSRMGKIKDKN